jgi:glycosyltransferase involved in cell wall biosynthesis
MLNRLIGLLLDTSVQVNVIDCSQTSNAEFQDLYNHIRLSRWEGQLLRRILWPLVHRLGFSKLNDWFWSCMLDLTIIITALRLGSVAMRQRPNYYLVCDLTSALAGLVARIFVSAPTIYMAYEIESEQGFGDSIRIQHQVLRAWEDFVLPKVDYLVAPNQARADFYAERHKLRNAPIVVRNCPPKTHIARTKRLHQHLGLSEDTKIVLYHGALIPHRALDDLVKSAAFFPQETVLVIIGRQNEFFDATLRPLLESEVLKDRVFFLPFIAPTEIMDYVASADLGVVIYENLNLNNYLCAPTKLYEYIMAGVPIIASDYPEPHEVIATYDAGITISATDPESIAAAVTDFFAHKRTIGAAFEAAREVLNWEGEGRKLMALLNLGVS